MKIALIVFRYGPSHGSILQTYALTRTLERLGHKVTIIDRQSTVNWHSYYMLLRRVVKSTLYGHLSILDFYVGDYSPILMRKLKTFIDKELRQQTISIKTLKELYRIGMEDYDAFVVGSDQTWRPKYVYNVYNYYLDFVPKERQVRRVAYAPSFGTSNWEYTEEQEIKCRSLIHLFDGVSVRENDGVKMCKDHFGINAVHVLDPTMLLSASEYHKFINKDSVSDYIGYNFLNTSTEKLELTKYVSKTFKLPTKQLISMDGKNLKAKDRIAPSIEEWLTGIAKSKFVIVDSFHATVFSIIFHKNFLAFGNVSRGLSRFTSLLNVLGLQDRLVMTGYKISEDIILKPINWEEVDSRWEQLKSRSLNFIIDYLK